MSTIPLVIHFDYRLSLVFKNSDPLPGQPQDFFTSMQKVDQRTEKQRWKSIRSKSLMAFKDTHSPEDLQFDSWQFSIRIVSFAMEEDSLIWNWGSWSDP